MSSKRQNNQLRLAFGREGRSEAPKGLDEGTETLTAKRMIKSPADNNERNDGGGLRAGELFAGLQASEVP
jgi:hypothetical protein